MKLGVVEGWMQETGLRYEIEPGKKHHKLKLEGVLVGIFPKGGSGIEGRAAKNIRAQIRRKAKELENGSES